ncbi:hypothetical protein HMPREF1396_00407 [Helicobacter pylori GAM114Ai]|uniref:DUF262 domain-containing protein n=1 Tax=Helicobacter pylori TaxID=210 RepID=UPI0002B9FDD7|nr:DUF262 domain-containing protein [Helicobacter pylori]EMG87825.1 hypothetical protein HMPREF1396_00407 [Helicobacter pylori GAM114Ai]WRE92656.1 DUF262 domain-containing protein [Helicobacter pylori]
MAKIESNDLNLRDILKDELYYQIPIYQRPYQWTEENCEKLLDDLFFNYEDDRESDYFCGSLVLILISEDSKKAKTYDIVDGQQRLSTFILLAKVLAALYSERLTEESKDYLQESVITKYGKKDRLNFSAVGFNSKKDFQYALTSFNDAPVSNNKNNYLKNAICLKNYLRKKEIEDINDFIEWLYFKVVFITITCPDADKALRIFNVLNARGLALNATDIFKGELLKHAKEHEREEFVSRWNDLSQKCSDNDLTIETLFSWYLTYLNPVTSKEKTDKRLVTWFNKLNKTPLEYLKGVEDFYNAYCEVLEMQDRHAYLLSYKDDDYLYVILCASLLHRYSDQDIEALKELLVKFYYQDWVAGQTRSTRSQTCCNIIKALKEKKSVRYIASIVVKKYLDDKNITQRFKENLEDDHLYTKFYLINGKTPKKNSWLKPILILVNYFMSDNANPAYIKMDDDLHVERILPQNPDPSSQWVRDFSEEERGLYTHSLANLTLLGGTKNAQASNLDFKEKKEIYMGNAVKLGKDKRGREKTFKVMTCYDMTKNDVCRYTEWTSTSLEKRKEELIQKIESVLAL